MSNGTKQRVPVIAEALEARRFLSGTPGVPPADSLYEIIGVEVEEDDDEHTEVDFGSLPAVVRAGIESAYPGGILQEATFDHDDTSYEVLIEVGDETIEMSLTSTGMVKETSRTVSLSDLPPTLVQAINSAYPGAEIDQVELIDIPGVGTRYEAVIEATQGQSLELTLESTGPTQPTLDSSQTRPELDDYALIRSSAGDAPAASSSGDVIMAAGREAPADGGTEKAVSAELVERQIVAYADEEETAPNLTAVEIVADRRDSAEWAATIPEAAANTTPQPTPDWQLSPWLKMSVSNFERHVETLLDELAALQHKLLDVTAPASPPAWIALLAFAGAARFFLIKRREGVRSISKINGHSSASWGWMLGTGSVTRFHDGSRIERDQ